MPTEDVTNSIDHDRAPQRGQKNPEWAAGLRRLYDSVVEEPLPDSFTNLLDMLDDGNA